jgi:hypothetical protein
MPTANGLRQPVLGVIAAVISVFLSLAICAQFDPPTFGSWVALIVMSAIPLQIVIGLVWQSNYPGFLASLPQPAKGLTILAMMAVAAAVVTPAILAVVGGRITPPTPFAIMFTIVSVCTAFWIVAVFQCWPMTAASKHPAVIGLGVFVLAYLSCWVVFRVAFDFAAMKDAPFYLAALDPHGAFPAWNALAFIVTTVSVIMWFVMLDFWPTAVIAGLVPGAEKQPVFGLISAALVIGLAALAQGLCVSVLHMDVVDYMVRVPVSGLFGEFIMLVMMQTAPVQTVRQPAKGLILLALVCVLALVMYRVYAAAAVFLVGPMPAGAPTYGLDLWVATAMLSITFPVFVAFGDGLAFWPLSRPAPAREQEMAKAAR